MDEIDREILQLIQEKFPLSERPFRDIAAGLELHPGLSEAEVIKRIGALTKSGVIRRIGAVIDGGAVGIVTTLLGAEVPKDSIDTFVDVVNSYSRVTHNYLRNEERNIWFTLWARSIDELENTINEIKERTEIADIVSFPSKKTYKIRAVFDIPNGAVGAAGNVKD